MWDVFLLCLIMWDGTDYRSAMKPNEHFWWGHKIILQTDTGL